MSNPITPQELIELAKKWEPSKEYLEGYLERLREFEDVWERLSNR